MVVFRGGRPRCSLLPRLSGAIRARRRSSVTDGIRHACHRSMGRGRELEASESQRRSLQLRSGRLTGEAPVGRCLIIGQELSRHIPSSIRIKASLPLIPEEFLLAPQHGQGHAAIARPGDQDVLPVPGTPGRPGRPGGNLHPGQLTVLRCNDSYTASIAGKIVSG